MLTDKPIDFDRFIRWLIAAGLLVATFLLVRRLSAVLLPFLLAWLTAYILNPVVDRGQRYLKNRVVSVLLTLVIIFGLATVLIIIMIPVVTDEFRHLYALITDQLENLDWPAWLPRNVAEEFKQTMEGLELSDLLNREGVSDTLVSGAGTLWAGVIGVYGFLGVVFGIVTYFLYLAFIMIDYDEINAAWITYVPQKYRPRVQQLLDDLEVGMNGYFRAQSKIVFVVAILFAIGFKVIGLPFGIVLGILVGLLNYVPYLQIAGMAPALFLGTLNAIETGQSIWAAVGLVLLVFTIVQLAQDAYITPKFLGDFSGFNPAIILLSLSIWGSLLGMVGLIIAIPMTSLLLNYYKRYLLRKPIVKTNSYD